MPSAAPTKPAARLGAKIRLLRRQEGLSQVQLAEALGISPSYLNLIEGNKRPLTAPLLIRLAQQFHLDLRALAPDEDQRLSDDLMEAFGDPLFESLGLQAQDVRELVQNSPTLARGVFELYRAYQHSQDSLDTLADKLSDGQGFDPEATRLPSEEVGDFLQQAMNHFPELEVVAEELCATAGLDADQPYPALAAAFEARNVQIRIHRVSEGPGLLRRYDPDRRILSLSELLPQRSRTFQLAHQLALLDHGDLLDRLADHPLLRTNASKALARVALANYFAGAVIMPYERFLRAAKSERYDIDILARRFQASFEQVCHRLTTLRRPGAEGVPFHFLRIDIAGNISKSFSASGIRFARFSGACPRWNAHAAFLTPGLIRTQLSEMPDGRKYFCIARTIQKDTGGYRGQHAMQALGLGCEMGHAKELIYADGLRLDQPPVPIGVTCRLCERTDCEQRAFPPLQQAFKVEENLRRTSFYARIGGN
ncbi:helix-turn-helix domain-containing protein [Geothrix paludis]|uniref:helix-turn-helix domain-containing protein n=1 Tax=Geothrix paludis TaxID=2922722 RepID=UPI001FAE06FC|nr:short-chain fatty acyl-CoA regulator family protein [Geothrix paludis]